MHVGLVIDDDLETTSGGYRYDRTLVSFLEERGDEVDVISLAGDLESTGGSPPDTAVTVPKPAIRDRLDRPYDVLLQDELCYSTLVEHNSHLERPGAIVSIVHLLRAGDPAVDDPAVRRRERRYLESIDAAVCPSADTRERIRALVGEDYRLPTLVAPPAGRHEDAALSAGAVRDRARTEPFRIAFVGNVVPRKNLETLLEALARVAAGDWRLTVVGSFELDPDYARTVRERAKGLGVDDRVAFAGRVPTAALESVLERSQVLAVPSRYESFGMVYLEAMEYGVVPIAGAVGGASEFVADGRNGVVVDPSDPGEIAARLEALATDRDRLAELGSGALETAAAHPTWDETLARVRAFCRRQVAVSSEHSDATGGDSP